MQVKEDTSILEDLLDGRSEDFKERVLTVVAKMGLGVNDPAFLFAVALGQLEILLKDSPQSMSRLFNVWTSELRKTLDLAETVLVQQQKEAIAKAAAELIQRHEDIESRRLWRSIVPAAGIVLGAAGLGFVAGVTVPPYLQGGLVDKPVQLTRDQVDALDWAMSKEGERARDLMKWNAGYLDGCEEQAKALGVQLSWGVREAQSGFCVLWVQPPSKRSWVEAE
jgi:hypothetical protein